MHVVLYKLGLMNNELVHESKFLCDMSCFMAGVPFDFFSEILDNIKCKFVLHRHVPIAKW